MYKFAIFNDENQFRQIIDRGDDIVGIRLNSHLAEYCITNICEQKLGNSTSSIEEALNCELPRVESTIVTSFPDLDSVGAMALIDIRMNMIEKNRETGLIMYLDKEVIRRVNYISDSYKFSKGMWPGKRSLPTIEKRWSEEIDSFENTRYLVAISKVVTNNMLSFEKRLGLMKDWLLSGKESVNHRFMADEERGVLIGSLNLGEIKTKVFGNIALVEGNHKDLVNVGFHLAPVVVTFNPVYESRSSETYRRFTISSFNEKYLDMNKLKRDLNNLEEGWFGSKTCIKSPYYLSSHLCYVEIINLVQKHLLISV